MIRRRMCTRTADTFVWRGACFVASRVLHVRSVLVPAGASREVNIPATSRGDVRPSKSRVIGDRRLNSMLPAVPSAPAELYVAPAPSREVAPEMNPVFQAAAYESHPSNFAYIQF